VNGKLYGLTYLGHVSATSGSQLQQGDLSEVGLTTSGRTTPSSRRSARSCSITGISLSTCRFQTAGPCAVFPELGTRFEQISGLAAELKLPNKAKFADDKLMADRSDPLKEMFDLVSARNACQTPSPIAPRRLSEGKIGMFMAQSAFPQDLPKTSRNISAGRLWCVRDGAADNQCSYQSGRPRTTSSTQALSTVARPTIPSFLTPPENLPVLSRQRTRSSSRCPSRVSSLSSRPELQAFMDAHKTRRGRLPDRSSTM